MLISTKGAGGSQFDRYIWGCHFVTGSMMHALSRTGRIDKLFGGRCDGEDFLSGCDAFTSRMRGLWPRRMKFHPSRFDPVNRFSCTMALPLKDRMSGTFASNRHDLSVGGQIIEPCAKSTAMFGMVALVSS